MDKKTLITVGALAAFLLIWQTLILPSFPEDMLYKKALPQVSSPENSSTAPLTGNSTQQFKNTMDQALDGRSITSEDNTLTSTPQALKVPALPEQIFNVETNSLSAVFSSKGGALKSLSLKDYHPTIQEKKQLFLIQNQSLLINGDDLSDYKGELTKNNGKQTLVFENGQDRIIYRFKDESHFFDLEVSRQNDDDWTISIPDLDATQNNSMSTINRGTNGAIAHLRQREYKENSDAIVLDKDNPLLALNAPVNDLVWAGFRNKYFTLFIEPKPDNTQAHSLNYRMKETKGELLLTIKDTKEAHYQFYAGPVDKPFLYDVDQDKYGPFFNYTGINFIIHFLLGLLTFYNSIPGINMGLAIVLLTFTVKAALFPMNLKAQSSMFMMSKIGPKVKELQAKYKNDRQQLGVEQMKLFKDNGVNPVAGCLPMLVQMPVLISLFSTVGEGFPLRHAPFLGWIQDLSAPDALMKLAFDLPMLGNGDGTTNLNLLVIFYIVTMLIQQSMMPKSEDPQQQQMQKMMKFMMIGFAVILYNYSSGLMLYFVGSNSLGMAESWYIRNRVLPAMEKKRDLKNK
jgi:YidC/Oxa1 family membrane protein insertase